MARDGSDIISVEGRVYRCAVDEPFGYAKGFVAARESAVARLVTADGTVGWGEAYAPADATAVAIAALGRRFAGRSVFEREAVAQAVATRLGSRLRNAATAGALSALAVAAADAAAKIADQPLWSLLGGAARPRLRPYASALWFRPADDPTAHYGEALRAARAQGFGAVKAKIGAGVEADRRAIERIIGSGEGMAIMVDANQAYAPAEAAQLATIAADADLRWLEEPLPADRLDDFAALRGRSRIAIAGGETVASLADAHRWLEAGAVDILQPDLCLSGGVEAAIAISHMAASAGTVLAPHCYGLGLGLAASLHWASAIADLGPDSAPVWIEVDTAPHPARDMLLADCAWFGGGGSTLAIPTAPGIGVDLDRIADFRVR